MIDRNPTLGHHFLEITQAKRIGDVPTHAGQDHLQRIVEPFKHACHTRIHRLHSSPTQPFRLSQITRTPYCNKTPGDVIGTVTEPVYDTATGRYLLIPQGSRIFGKYNSQVAYGQSRVQVVWNRVILPDTSSLTLDNLAGTDPAGYAGVEDGVDWHWDRIFAGAALTTLLGVGAELAAPENRQGGDRVIIAGRDSLQDSVNQAGQEMTRRNLNIQPTLTERPGLPVRIIVNRDLVLRPYQPLFFNRGTSQ
jgi:type IV secretory pathway VirB10-like protein